MEGATVYQGKVHVKLCLECGLEAMVAWTRSEFAVNGIEDTPKKETEILIKMFHIIMYLILCFLIKRKWMGNIVLDILFREKLSRKEFCSFHYYMRYAINSRKLQKELGWVPSLQFEEGIEENVKWYLENQEWMDHVNSGEYQKYYDNMYKDR